MASLPFPQSSINLQVSYDGCFCSLSIILTGTPFNCPFHSFKPPFCPMS